MNIVKRYDVIKGFGFITGNKIEDYFVHVSVNVRVD